MAKAYVLSEDDRELLREMAQDYLTQLLQGPSDPNTIDDYRTSGAHIAYPDDAAGIPAMETVGTADPAPGSGECTIYQLSAAALPSVVKFGFKETVYNLQSSVIPQSYFLVHRLKTGGWVAGPASTGLVGIQLDEAHPGRNIKFDVLLGEWDPDTDNWIYVGTATEPCIDCRYGVPYPSTGSTGLAIWRPSTLYGQILEVVALDCEAPPS